MSSNNHQQPYEEGTKLPKIVEGPPSASSLSQLMKDGTEFKNEEKIRSLLHCSLNQKVNNLALN